MNDFVDAGGTIPIVTARFVDSSNTPLTGLTVNLAIRRMDTGDYWDGASWGAWDTVVMTETDSTNLPGMFHYNFSPASSGFYCLVSIASISGGTPANVYQSGTLVVGIEFSSVDLTGIATTANVNTRVSYAQLQAEIGAIKGTTWSSSTDTLEDIRNAVDAISGVDVLQVEVNQSAELRGRLNYLTSLTEKVRLLTEIISKEVRVARGR